jgi:surface polysaccharide O-acyltransferase-like enzyme
MNNVTIKKRSFSMDLLRVIACYLVINQHASEFYYIGNNGTTIPGDNSFWIGIMTSFGRISVPLFVMISGFFLIPMKDTTSQFFKKRLTRVVYPFIFWCIGYAVFFFFYNGETIHMMFSHIIHIPINYGTEVGHLWYIYMIIGLYLLIPILTPWLRKLLQERSCKLFFGSGPLPHLFRISIAYFLKYWVNATGTKVRCCITSLVLWVI